VNYADIYAEHIRICILRVLAGGVYTCNDSILHDILTKKYAIMCGRDEVKAQLAWLKDRMLVSFVVLESGTLVVTVSQTGLDVAAGNLTVPGVKRPAPGDIANG
jgi:hypothetical protein